MFEDICLEESEKSGSFIFLWMRIGQQFKRKAKKMFPITIVYKRNYKRIRIKDTKKNSVLFAHCLFYS